MVQVNILGYTDPVELLEALEKADVGFLNDFYEEIGGHEEELDKELEDEFCKQCKAYQCNYCSVYAIQTKYLDVD